MSGADAHQQLRKKRKLVIGSDDEEDAEQLQQQGGTSSPAKNCPEKDKEPEPKIHNNGNNKNGSKIQEQQSKPTQDTNKRDKDAPSKSQSTQDASRKQDKIQRKEEESKSKIEATESDGHASDKDLFQPDDSKSEDIEAIRQKYGWKKKSTPPPEPKFIEKSPAKPQNKPSQSSNKFKEENVRKPKDALIYDVLKRWWFALPDWPPANFDYTPSLEANKLRVVSRQKFRNAPEVDERGFSKCQEILGYEGVFSDFNVVYLCMNNGLFNFYKQNRQYDLRPLENKPCYTEFVKKDKLELISLLKLALKNQLESLKGSKVIDPKLLEHLERLNLKMKDR